MLLRRTDGETDHTRATEGRKRGALDEYVEERCERGRRQGLQLQHGGANRVDGAEGVNRQNGQSYGGRTATRERAAGCGSEYRSKATPTLEPNKSRQLYNCLKIKQQMRKSTAVMREAWAMLPESSSWPLPATPAQSRNLAHASLETAVRDRSSF